jgi:hypothetical protein
MSGDANMASFLSISSNLGPWRLPARKSAAGSFAGHLAVQVWTDWGPSQNLSIPKHSFNFFLNIFHNAVFRNWCEN